MHMMHEKKSFIFFLEWCLLLHPQTLTIWIHNATKDGHIEGHISKKKNPLYQKKNIFSGEKKHIYLVRDIAQLHGFWAQNVIAFSEVLALKYE